MPGADAELYLLLKNLNRMKDARTLITSAYERGGNPMPGIVIKYAGMLRAFGETQQDLDGFKGAPATGTTSSKITSSVLGIYWLSSINLKQRRAPRTTRAACSRGG